MRNLRELPKLRDSLSYAYFEQARIEQADKAVAVVDTLGEVHVPAASLGVLMLGPGTTITHAAVKNLADSGCTIIWVGDGGNRMYACGQSGTRRAKRLLHQAQLHVDPATRAAVALKMYEYRFQEELPPNLTLPQIRGKEGVRVRTAYQRASAETGVMWRGRQYDRSDWHASDWINRALSTAAACLNGICHCAVVSAGYSSALGFIHTGKMLSFVYDIADLYRLDVIVPLAFQITARRQLENNWKGFGSEIRAACRDAFREYGLLEKIVEDIDKLLQVSTKDIDRGAALFDHSDDPPGDLWDAETGEVQGGVSYGPDHPGESTSGP